MKLVVKASTNSVNMPAKPEVIEAAEENDLQAALLDKIKDAESDFDFLMAGLEQLDPMEANNFLEDIHADIRGFIDDVTNAISE